MIKEFVQFTENLSHELKSKNLKVREGLHILIKLIEVDNEWQLDIENLQYRRYTKKMMPDEFLNHFAPGLCVFVA
ncbi:MAG TPA: hypothetical protein DCS93_04230 [Microscillaceae bacterium]|nr:hypothetical protein [Microscillaceae bacterium]